MMRSHRRRPRAGLALLMSFGLIAAACGGNDDGSTSDPVPESDGADTDDTGDEDTETDDSGDSDGDSDGEAGSGDVDDGEIAEDGEIEVDIVEDEDTGPTQGGVLRYGLEADVDGLNPTSSALSSPGAMMASAALDTLTMATPDGEFVPYLAESVTPNETFDQWRVTVRPGIFFHDGTPLNAEALVANFEAQRNDPLVGLAVRPSYPAEGASEIIDDLTVQYNLVGPNRYFPGALATTLGMVASPAWLAAAIEDPTLNQSPVGTGPFIFESRSEDSVTRFVRNDDWWNGEVYLDAIEFSPVPDPDTRNDLLFDGAIDALQTTNPASVQDLLDDDEIQNVIDETGEESFVMINAEAPPFDDIRAREALANATPRERYSDLVGLGLSTEANQRYIESSRFYNPDVVQVGDNPARALELVAEYCAERGDETNPILNTTTCTDGKINMELQWSGPSVIQTRIADIFDQAWGEAGFNVTFDEKAQDAHIQEAALGTYNTVTWRQFGATDPMLDNVWLQCATVGPISINWPRLCDEDRDALLLEAQTLDNGPEREAVYQEVEALIASQFTYIFLLHTKWDNAFAPEVRGMCDRTSPEGVELICVTNGRSWFDTVYIVE